MSKNTMSAILLSLIMIGAIGIASQHMWEDSHKTKTPEFISTNSVGGGPLMWDSYSPYGKTGRYGLIPAWGTVQKEIYVIEAGGQTVPYLVGNLTIEPWHWGYRDGVAGMIIEPLNKKIGRLEIDITYENSNWGGKYLFELDNSSTTTHTEKVDGFDFATKNLLSENLSEEAYYVKEKNRTRPEIGFGDGNITFAINLKGTHYHYLLKNDTPPKIGEILRIRIYAEEANNYGNLLSTFDWPFTSGGFKNGTLKDGC